jgi:hypothetical protein
MILDSVDLIVVSNGHFLPKNVEFSCNITAFR